MESLSIVIPCYNSGKKLSVLADKLINNISLQTYEIIFINDCSTDDTWENIKNLSLKYSAVKGISLKKNMGQQNAVFTGLLFCSGDYVITMDDDLEHDPDNINMLIEKAEEGYDLVYAAADKKYSLFRKTGSLMHDLFFYTAFRKPFKLKITSYRIIKKNLVKKITESEKRFIYISAIALSFNPKTDFIKTAAVKITESRYSKLKLVKLFNNLIIHYSIFHYIFYFMGFKNSISAKQVIINSIDQKFGDFNL